MWGGVQSVRGGEEQDQTHSGALLSSSARQLLLAATGGDVANQTSQPASRPGALTGPACGSVWAQTASW